MEQNPTENLDAPIDEKRPIEFFLNIERRKDKVGINGNWIAAAGVLVNIILAIFTYNLWEEAIEATKAAKKSADAAELAANESQRANGISENNYKLADSSFKQQMQLANEARKQFEIENRPFLQIDDITLKEWKTGNKVKFTYYIRNLGNHPVRITAFKTGWLVEGIVKRNINAARESFAKKPASQYVTKDNPALKVFTTEGPIIPNHFFDSMEAGQANFIYTGEIYYTNVVTGRPFKYLFTIKFDTPNQATSLLENDNVPI